MQSILIIFNELKSGHTGDALMVISGYSYNIYVLHWEVDGCTVQFVVTHISMNK